MNLEKCFVTDEEVLSVIKDVENDEETATKKAVEIQLALLVDIRRFLRHINNGLKKSKTKVHKKPTGNKKDIIVGKENKNKVYKGTSCPDIHFNDDGNAHLPGMIS